MSLQFENLGQLLGCYFHQDFVEDYGSAEGALAEMLRGAPVEQRRLGAGEITNLLDLNLGEDETKRILEGRLGCYYAFESGGFGACERLRHVQDRLQESIGDEDYGTSGV